MSRAEVRVAKETDLPPPIIIHGPVNQTLPIKASATLPCEASDHETIVWLKDGVPISTLVATETRIYVDNENTLTIKGKTQNGPIISKLLTMTIFPQIILSTNFFAI